MSGPAIRTQTHPLSVARPRGERRVERPTSEDTQDVGERDGVLVAVSALVPVASGDGSAHGASPALLAVTVGEDASRAGGSAGALESATTLVAAAIEGIVVASRASPSAARGSFDNTLLLRSGRAFLGLVGSPLELVPPPPDADGGSRWTLWRDVEGGVGYEIRDPASGLWRPLQGRLFEPLASLPPERLAGSLARSRSRASGGTTATSHEHLTLALDGTFSRTRSALTTSAAPSGVGVPTVVHVPAAAPSAGRLGGTYALLEDGFTLELVYADGTRERSLMLDDGGSRILDGRRYTFSDDDVATIDLVALMRRWTADREEPGDWRAAIAEAMARGVEERALVGAEPSRGRPRVPPTIEPDPPPEPSGAGDANGSAVRPPLVGR